MGEPEHTDLRLVNIDTINELKFSGKRKEARMVLDRWLAWKKREKQQMVKEFRVRDTLIKKHQGVCINNRCYNLAMTDCDYCDVCWTAILKQRSANKKKVN